MQDCARVISVRINSVGQVCLVQSSSAIKDSASSCCNTFGGIAPAVCQCLITLHLLNEVKALLSSF